MKSSEITRLPVLQVFSKAQSLVTMFQQGGEVVCIDKAIIMYREILELLPGSHPTRSTVLVLLANPLRCRYQQLGAINNLSEAIVLAQDALALCPSGHPDR